VDLGSPEHEKEHVDVGVERLLQSQDLLLRRRAARKAAKKIPGTDGRNDSLLKLNCRDRLDCIH
jgi:hypothetical protein